MRPPDISQAVPNGSKRAVATLLVVLTVGVGLAGGTFVWSRFQALQHSSASNAARDFVLSHPSVQEDLGTPIQVDGLVLGWLSDGSDTGSGWLTFRVSSSRGSGRARVTLEEKKGAWHVTAALYDGSNGGRQSLEVKKHLAPTAAQPDEPQANSQDTARDRLARARELEKAGKHQEALEELNALLEQSPDHAEALYWRARLRTNLGQEEAAREDILRAVALNIDLQEAYLLHDFLLAKQRRWEEIIAAWTHYLERHPDDSRALLERAGTYQHHGDRQHAFEDLRRSCELGNAQACTILHREQGG